MKRILIVAAIAAPCLLALSYPWRDATRGAGAVLSSIGWFGFLLALVTVVVASATLAARKLRTHRA
ncbi:MAG: hypothetical protein ACYC1Z_13380 [Georgenia sp.]